MLAVHLYPFPKYTYKIHIHKQTQKNLKKLTEIFPAGFIFSDYLIYLCMPLSTKLASI